MREIFSRLCTAVATLWLGAAVAVGATSRVDVAKLDGSRVEGELTAWTAHRLTLSVDGESVDLSAAELLSVDWSNVGETAETPPAILELVDGTRIPIERYAVTGDLATFLTPLAGEPLSISTERIHSVRFAENTSEAANLWRELDEKNFTGDLLVIRKKKTGRLDYLSGIVGDITDERVEFDWEGEQIPVRRKKVAAVVYYHAEKVEPAQPNCWLLTQTGARLPLAAGEIVGQQIHVATIGGLELQILLASVSRADYSAGKLAYLSDLQPLRQKWTPRIGLPRSAEIIAHYGQPRRDQSFSGSPLSLAWPTEVDGHADVVTYTKGLALRSRTELLYRIPAGMKRFVAVAGIDPLTSSEGAVLLSISGGDRGFWQAEIDGGATPTEIDVDLGDAQQLRIVVDYGTNLDFGDRLHLVEARLSK